MPRRAFSGWVLCALASLALAGCHRAQARTVPDSPPLDVPLPPPRLVETAETEPPEPIALIPEPARNTPSLRTTPATQPRPEPTKPEAAKVEPVPVEPAKEEPRARALTTLQTTPTDREGEVERRIRGLLLEATNNLNRVDYNRLNADAKGQYDSAKGFVRQAEEALRGKNLVFANYLADKAATLAAQLRGR